MACQSFSANYSGFARAVTTLHRTILLTLGTADLRHLRRIERWGRWCSIAGYAAAAWCFNPIAALLISQGNLTRWLLMHHIGHRGYDRVPGVPGRYTSQVFARGWRRAIDWFDWILPEAWCFEHNILHHYHTGEAADPDLVEHNLAGSWMNRQRPWVRYVLVAFFAMTWKLSYYAPNTFMVLHNNLQKKQNKPLITSWWSLFSPLQPAGRVFWRRCILPYGLVRFALLPMLFLPLGPEAAAWVLCNSIMAEIFTNVHTFMAIAPNHAGDDLYRFDAPEKNKVEYYARQVMGSTNYWCGNDRLDFAQMWLNYQIEHHVWPDLPMLQYQRFQPQLKALCHEHGLPYVQQSIFVRCRKLLQVMVGKTCMRRAMYARELPQTPQRVLT